MNQSLDMRLAVLADLSETPDEFLQTLIWAQPLVHYVAGKLGRPGLFLGEDDQLEARWIRQAPSGNEFVINMTFTASAIETYVYDRGTETLTTLRTIEVAA